MTLTALIAARDASGLLAAEAYMIVHHPQWQRARQMVADGAIGRVLHITGGFSYDNSAVIRSNIRNQPEMGGGGPARYWGLCAWIGTLCHGLRSERYFRQNSLWESGFDTVCISARRAMGDATYSAYVSTRMHPHQEMVFHGSEGPVAPHCALQCKYFWRGAH